MLRKNLTSDQPDLWSGKCLSTADAGNAQLYALGASASVQDWFFDVAAEVCMCKV